MQKEFLKLLARELKKLPDENFITGYWEYGDKVSPGGLACRLFEKEGLKFSRYKLNDLYRQPRFKHFMRYQALEKFFGLKREQTNLIFYPYTVSRKADHPYKKEDVVKIIEQIIA